MSISNIAYRERSKNESDFSFIAAFAIWVNDPEYCNAADPVRVQLKWGSKTTKYDANSSSESFC